jgi:hypothetical protein
MRSVSSLSFEISEEPNDLVMVNVEVPVAGARQTITSLWLSQSEARQLGAKLLLLGDTFPAELVDRFFKDLQDSTWNDSFEDARKRLEEYRKDIQATVRNLLKEIAK